MLRVGKAPAVMGFRLRRCEVFEGLSFPLFCSPHALFPALSQPLPVLMSLSLNGFSEEKPESGYFRQQRRWRGEGMG